MIEESNNEGHYHHYYQLYILHSVKIIDGIIYVKSVKYRMN